jgi:DNA-directed RNA polymerase
LKSLNTKIKLRKKVISVSLLGRNREIVIRENINKLDTAKQSQGIISNFIHSLVASHLINLINRAYDDDFYSLITIHDCFATIPNKMFELDQRVKSEFILLYSKSEFLNNFHNRFMESIKDNRLSVVNIPFDVNSDKSYVILENDTDKIKLEIPSLLLVGDLILEDIKNSKYMIF